MINKFHWENMQIAWGDLAGSGRWTRRAPLQRISHSVQTPGRVPVVLSDSPPHAAGGARSWSPQYACSGGSKCGAPRLAQTAHRLCSANQPRHASARRANPPRPRAPAPKALPRPSAALVEAALPPLCGHCNLCGSWGHSEELTWKKSPGSEAPPPPRCGLLMPLLSRNGLCMPWGLASFCLGFHWQSLMATEK